MEEQNLGFTCNQKEIEILCNKWKRKLGLSHWDIIVKICRENQMPRKDCEGVNNFNIALEKSIISIMDPLDFPCNSFGFKYDMEITLVHELLHICVKYFTQTLAEDTLDYYLLEAYIERTAKLLVSQQREIDKLMYEE